MDLAFQNYITNNIDLFKKKVIDISKILSINPNWLMAVMYLESKINPKARNTKFPFKNGYATGLIQFTPDTAIGLGTTVDALYKMSAINQLDFVLKYLMPFKGKMKSFADVYAAVFFPLAVGKPDTFVLQTDTLKASTVARNNPIFDLDKSLSITKEEFKKAVSSLLPKGYSKYINSTTVSIAGIIFGISVLSFTIYVVSKNN